MYAANSGGLGRERSMAKQLGESDAPHLEACALEKAAAGLQLMVFKGWIHGTVITEIM